ALGKGFIPVRKEGKLPRDVIKVDYGLEYGENVLTIHKDAVKPGQRVLITDDLLATGGTIEATIELVEKLGGVIVGCAFLIEVGYLEGERKLEDYEVITLVKYESVIAGNLGDTMAKDENSTIKDIIHKVEEYMHETDVAFVQKGYDYADKAHRGETRESG